MSDSMQQIEAIFHDACDLAPNKRAAFLMQACAGDEAMRRAVEALLAYDNKQKILSNAQPWSLLRANFLPTLLLLKWLPRRHAGTYE